MPCTPHQFSKAHHADLHRDYRGLRRQFASGTRSAGKRPDRRFHIHAGPTVQRRSSARRDFVVSPAAPRWARQLDCRRSPCRLCRGLFIFLSSNRGGTRRSCPLGRSRYGPDNCCGSRCFYRNGSVTGPPAIGMNPAAIGDSHLGFCRRYAVCHFEIRIQICLLIPSSSFEPQIIFGRRMQKAVFLQDRFRLQLPR